LVPFIAVSEKNFTVDSIFFLECGLQLQFLFYQKEIKYCFLLNFFFSRIFY